jgi:hypothetical protein
VSSPQKMAETVIPTAWAWEIQEADTERWVLCHWALPSVGKLVAYGKPSPESRIVQVRLVRMRKGRGK